MILSRSGSLASLLDRDSPWDIAIIGGGATGMGCALDAASRGYAVCLLEQSDFGKGTSSRSTKLIHGGIRYLQQANVSLVKQSLHERAVLQKNAPHAVTCLPFVLPTYAPWQTAFYAVGLKLYDALAKRSSFPAARVLSKSEALAHIPTLNGARLRGGILYHDGQFDDARLLLDMAHTAAKQGAVLLNYAPVLALLHDASRRLIGLCFRDAETGTEYELRARCIINAAGPFADAVRALDEPTSPAMIAPSQGVHIVLPRAFLPGDAALIIPRTPDQRVLFAIPWHGHALLGTTDTPVSAVPLDPVPTGREIDFILSTAGVYLSKKPTRADILSTFAGIRPLVRRANAGRRTSSLSRDHTLQLSASGLVTIAGGKWTTYRRMAEDAVTHAAAYADLPARPCVTEHLAIMDAGPLPSVEAPMHGALAITEGQLLHGIRQEMARTVDDLLSRRTRALFLNAAAAVAMAPRAAALLAVELGRDEQWREREVAEFTQLARTYGV